MELMISYFIVMLLHHLVSSGFVGILGNTFTNILNRHYHEDAVIVRKKLECTMFCVYTEFCEAFYYDTAAAEDSKCLLRKYTTNILYPLIINTTLPSNKSVMFLQKHSEYCVVPPGYQFEPDLLFWYKLVTTPTLNATDAREACRQDKAYLLLIDDENQYNFIQNLLQMNTLPTVYIQGVRTTANDPFLDEIGRPVTDAHWGNGGVGGRGNYMRFEDSWIETSTGTTLRAYICQLRLN